MIKQVEKIVSNGSYICEESIFTENWEPITGYEGLYEVSNFGRIKSLDRKVFVNRSKQKFYLSKKGRILKNKLTWDGYFETTLIDSPRPRKYVRTHILVAKEFIPNLKNKPMVNHKDGNKLNNKKSNLEWATAKENDTHARKMGLTKAACGEAMSKLTNKQVKRIRQLYENEKFKQNHLAQKFNVGKNCIWCIIHRITWRHL